MANNNYHPAPSPLNGVNRVDMKTPNSMTGGHSDNLSYRLTAEEKNMNNLTSDLQSLSNRDVAFLDFQTQFLGSKYGHPHHGSLDSHSTVLSDDRRYVCGDRELTTLQPLPPISIMSEKQAHMQHGNQGLSDFVHSNRMESAGSHDQSLLAYNYAYDNGAAGFSLADNDSNEYHQHQLNSAANYISYIQERTFPKNEANELFLQSSILPYESNQRIQLQCPTGLSNGLDSFSILNSNRCRSPGPIEASCTDSQDGEEINTKEVAQRIGSELKRYSIPQSVFAQQVLCRSQGTLSDLLRNPKPWSKLKSGRETFRRMWKWLQEPEYQRMATLRMIGKMSGN